MPGQTTPTAAQTDGTPRGRRRVVTEAPVVTAADLLPLVAAEEATEERLAAMESTIAELVSGLTTAVATLAALAEVQSAAAVAPVVLVPRTQPNGAPRSRPAPRARSRQTPEPRTETVKEAVRAVLRANRRRPMKAGAILDAMEARGGAVPQGLTPEASVSAMLATEHVKGGFAERTAPGMYRLRAGA